MRLGRQEISSAEYADQYVAAIRRAAAVFDGEDARHTPIQGWHTGGGLRGQLRALLPAGWVNDQRRQMFGDNPVAMYLDLLGAHLHGAMREARGDEARVGVLFGPHLQQAVRIITGSLSRA